VTKVTGFAFGINTPRDTLKWGQKVRDVRFGSEATSHVRFTPNSGRKGRQPQLAKTVGPIIKS